MMKSQKNFASSSIKEFLKDNYKILIGFVIFALLASASYSVWRDRNQKKQSVATSSLLRAIDAGKADDLKTLADHAPANQALLAQMILAGQLIEQDKKDQALEIYTKVGSPSTASFWRDLARFNSAALLSDKTNYAEAAKLLSSLTGKGNVLRPAALELKASAEAKQGDTKKAFADYAELSVLPEAGDASRDHAKQLMRFYQP